MDQELICQDDAIWSRLRADLAARQIETPRIVVHGGYGKHNLGDDAILEAILMRLKMVWPVANLSILCHNPHPVRLSHPSVEAYAFQDPRVLSVICRAHVYVIGGGGIVNRINTYSGLARARVLDPKGKYLFVAGWLSQLCGARLVFYSVGTTSIPDPLVGWLTRTVMNRADSVSVRDPLSQAVLRRLGVTNEVVVLPDPATMLRPAAAERAVEILVGAGVDPQRPLVGLCMRYVREPDIDNAAVVAQTARVVEWLVRDVGVQVLFMPFGRHPSRVVENDVAFADEVQARLGEVAEFSVLAQEYPAADVLAVLSHVALCIAGRLHASILSTVVHTPVIAISYDDKVTEFMKLSGQGTAVIPLGDFTLEALQTKWRELHIAATTDQGG